MYNYDIAIIGGGLAGLTQAILLGNQGWNVACIDRDTPETQSDDNYDIRTTAISWGSRNLLKNANIWQDIEDRAECISDILILDENSPIELEFNATDIEAEGFGWIVDNRDLRDVLFKHVQNNQNITHMTGQSVTDFQNETNHVTVTLANETQINAKLIIGADGRNSFTRDYMGVKTWKRDYNQTALVCLINHEKPHNGLALEHFRSQGPFAVLPFTNDDNGNHRSAIVWTVEGHDAQGWQTCSIETFKTAIQTRCGNHYGDINIIGSRAAWPLNVVKAHNYIGDRMVIIAEAAHGMHPIAGQGLNMSLRDIAAMTEILNGAPDPGDQTLLQSYQNMRSRDNWSMVVATDKLNDLFGSDFFAVRAARRFGLHAVSRLPFAKKFFMKQAMGATGNLPQLIKEAA
jgi:2-octaprenyl-6-methoxyphenol hydroxylase